MDKRGEWNLSLHLFNPLVHAAYLVDIGTPPYRYIRHLWIYRHASFIADTRDQFWFASAAEMSSHADGSEAESSEAKHCVQS